MTALDVDTGIYYSAAHACVGSAEDIDAAVTALYSDLSLTGQMLSDHAATRKWTITYDERAAHILTLSRDLSNGLRHFAEVVGTCGYNHGVAEHNNSGGTTGFPPEPPKTSSTRNADFKAPRSSGADAVGFTSDLVELLNEIHIPIPSGDPVKLARAGDAWKEFAGQDGIGSIADDLGIASAMLEDVKSPEVDHIRDHFRNLQEQFSELSHAADDLSHDAFAQKGRIDKIHEAIGAILKGLAEELLTTVALGVAATVLTAGFGAVVAVGKSIHTIRSRAKDVEKAVAASEIAVRAGKGVGEARDLKRVEGVIEEISALKVERVERDISTPKTGQAEHSSTASTGRYDGGLAKVDNPDPDADKLAEKLGGQPTVKFKNDPSGREFDAVSDDYIAQAKPANFQVNKAFRSQARATFEAAQETGRKVYYHFQGPPQTGVVEKLHQYAEEYGVELVIDASPF